jgi:uncharacterized protein (TIGR03067 family)
VVGGGRRAEDIGETLKLEFGRQLLFTLARQTLVGHSSPSTLEKGPDMRHSFAIKACILMAGLLGSLLFSCDVAAGQLGEIDDAKAVQGTWIPVKAELAGSPMPDAVLKTIILKIDQDKYEASVAGKLDRGTCTQDASAKPKRLTIRGTDGPNAGKTILAIYELSGDTFRVCYDLSGMKTPEDFKTAEGTKLYLVTYTRKKD